MGMKYSKTFLAEILGAAYADSWAAEPSAQAKKTIPARADVPWVSLAHQRQLREKSAPAAEQTDAVLPKDAKSKTVFSKIARAPELSADKFDYSQSGDDEIIASGNAKITDERFELSADKIKYSQKTGNAVAEGKVKASIDSSRVAAETFSYNAQKEELKTPHARFGSSPMFLETDKILSLENKISLDNPKLYVGEPSF